MEQENSKRTDYLPWADYFMALACLSAKRSKDPITQVGACIVNADKRIVGMGYNGMPDRCHDNVMPWGKTAADIIERKTLYVCHAEMNAIVNKNAVDLKNCTMYVTLFPCNECSKLVIQSGIKEVIYLSDKKKDKPEFQVSKKLFDIAGVKYTKFTPSKQKIEIDFNLFV